MVTVNQNARTGALLTTLSCTEASSYRILSISPNTSFLQVNSTSGDLRLAVDAIELDTGAYSVSLECTHPSGSNSATLTVMRVEENEFTPVFDNGVPTSVSIAENSAVATSVIHVMATDSDLGSYGSITYSILTPGIAQLTFQVDVSTGEVTLLASLDFEQMLTYQFFVSASNVPSDAGVVVSSSALVMVNVIDIDDTSPIFNMSNYELPLPENNAEPINVPLATTCTDQDTIDSSIRYGFSGGDRGPFQLDQITGQLSIPADGLDYETTTLYSFEITCFDNSFLNNSDSAQVDISVLPVNEGPPTVRPKFFPTSLSEYSPVGTVLGSTLANTSGIRYTATDSDDGPDGVITYTLVTDSEEAVISGMLEVDVNTGEIITVRQLDFDVDSLLSRLPIPNGIFVTLGIRISVCDVFPPPLNTDCPRVLINLFLTPINEFTPEFTQEEYNLSILESAGFNEVVGRVTCTDRDLVIGQFSAIDFSVASQAVLNAFVIDHVTGDIRVRNSLDYETTTNYGFHLVCNDTQGLNNQTFVSIEIIPVNDNVPVFDRNSYEFEVSRSTPANRYAVGRVSATDIDNGFGGDLVYSEEPNPYFRIESDGTVVLVHSIQNVSENGERFNAIVRDGPVGANTTNEAAAFVVIVFTEGNMNIPQFEAGSRSVEISELLPIGGVVTTVQCFDNEMGLNGEIRYLILGGNTDGVFNIDAVSGDITVAAVLTLPLNTTEERYTLHVVCEDLGVPRMSSLATILVRITQDDSSPPVISGNNTIFHFVDENTEINTVVIQINATDLDTDSLEFGLENESRPGVFIIDPSSGHVILGAPLDRETVSAYTMTVVVTERRVITGPERSDSAVLTILVRDVNDNAPMCDPSLLAVMIPDSLVRGDSIATLNCFDPDIGVNGHLTYSLLGDYDVLAVDDMGTIYLNNSLELEDRGILLFEVDVSDQGLPIQLQNTYHVTVSILSTNRNVPQILNLPRSISIPESLPLQSIVFTVEAEDPDRGSFGQLTYRILDTSDSSNFRIIPNTGSVLVGTKLNFFEQQVHTLNISVEDTDFIVSEVLVVNVDDVNEFSPVCEETLTTATIAEGLPAGQVLSPNLGCTDEDEGSNGEINFTVLSGDDRGIFVLTGDGVITVRESLDFEQEQQYSLLVMVFDGGTPPRSVNATVTVVVQAVNEYRPTFVQSSYAESIPENSTVGSSILTVTAMDDDLSRDGRVVYSISGLDSSLFTISSSGLLQVAGNLDRENQEVFSFVVTASDQGTPLMSKSVAVNITLTDIDDNPPEFTEMFYRITYDQQEDFELLVACNDPDAGTNGAVEYSLDSRSSDSEFFQISSSGVVQVNGMLVISRTYSFGVVCTGPPPAGRFDTAVVIIQAVVNTTITFLPSSTYTLTLNEDTSPVHDILTIVAISSTNTSLTYSLLTDDPEFRLDGSTGILRLVGNLDYEIAQSYALRVQASDNGDPPNLAEALVDILVGNVNDVIPIIAVDILPVLNRIEGPTLGIEPLLDIECSDQDAGIFGAVSFRIEGGNELGLFSLSSSGTISLVGDIDYETARSFALEIVCEDGGSPPQSDSVTLPVIVIPVNDNPPMFQQSAFTIGIQESLLVGSLIGNIMATDADLAPHGDIRYSIISSDATASPTFELAPTTGELTLLRSLDYDEGVRMFSLSVLAEDRGGGSEDPDFPVLNDTAMVVINVLDINDNSPVLSRSAYSGSIVEEVGVGAIVILVNNITCADADSGENGDVSFSIGSNAGNTAFQIHPDTGVVTAAQNLNFETQSSYSLTVSCVDHGVSPLSSEASLFVTVIDLNEFSPRFSNESGYVFDVLESALVGDEIGVIEATDEDAGDAGIVSYSFTNSSAAPLSLNPGTGVLTLTNSLDFETQSRQYILQAVASDNAGNSNEATVIVNVLNVDDHLPMFSSSLYLLSVRENAPRDALVGTVSCSDADNTALGIAVVYTMTSSSPFAVDGVTGEITVAGHLDLESISRYSIRIVCTDAAGNEAPADVTISLLPFNDFTPIFLQSRYNISVVENSTPGTSILQVRAVDDDTEEYSAITYTIVSGNGAGLFFVDTASGVLRASGDVDRENTAEHVLEVQAQNVIAPDDASGSSPLSSVATVFVEVLDVNDNSPVIAPSDPPPVFITESDGPFAFVLQLSCSDADVGVNGTTSFSITSPGSNERFQIMENGVLTTATLIRTNEVVTVTCSDSGIPTSLSTSVDISVNTMSVNDHPPMFDSANYTLRVREDTPIGEIVGCISATDRDGLDTPDGVIEYSLEFAGSGSGSGVSKFGIMESTGCVFVAIGLDFDVAMIFEYTAIATDGGVLTLQGNATLVVEIIDAIRDPPMFQDGSYTRMIPETVAVGFLIAQIACTDPDVNDTTTYSILDDPFQFSVDPANGRIATAASLDFESARSHTLDVACTDSFGLEDRAQVLITVLPINEFPPTFTSTIVDIEENSIVGREVTTLIWMDSDSGVDGEVTFTITSGNTDSVFSITHAGTVLVRGELDRESISFYQLNITVTDRSVSEPRLSMGQLNVTILDINDNRPVFAEDPYMFGPIEANETLGYSVGSVSCADNDTGSSAQTTFLISPDNENFTLFSVDGVTGEIVVGGDLRNRELDAVTFTVLCTDAGFPPLVGSARVLVRVEETNRYPPEFLNTSYCIEVPEDTAILDGTILTITAFDMDSGINGEIRYHLVDTFNGQFFLDERSGELSLTRPLDFEQRSLFSLLAVARDGAVDSSLMLRSTVEITVQVLGVNEHIPMCLNAIYVSVINATSQGSVVDFFCTDNDDGQDGQLRYAIIGGNQDHFVVGNDSLLIPTPIHQSDGREQFMLQVLVEDLGVPSRSVTVEVVVIYSFDNLAAPVFSQSSYSIDVHELTDVGTVVATLIATDNDPSIQGQIGYTVVSSDNFRIDANSGDLFVATPLDWETSPFLTFHVIAEDGDPLNPLSDIASVNVSVLNDNDNSPQCDRSFYTAQIPSNASVDTTVLTLNCSDLDQNPLTYTITSEATPYGIDSSTGRVFVSGPITEPTYLTSIEVSDDGGERITVVVNVATLFANIEPPRFDEPEYTFSVLEVAPLLTTIGSVQATDADSDSSDLIYSLVAVDFGGFYVNPSTGDLILTSPLDFEVTQSYSLTVQAADAGSFDSSNVLSSTAVIAVRVNNTNDNQPVFSDGGIYGRTVLETTPIGMSILTIICTDDDLVPFGSPSIGSDGFSGVPFSLQEVSMGEAEVVVSESLSGPNPYFVNVTCSDGGDQQVEGQVFLFVPEPLAPTFSQPVYEWVVSELSPTGTTYASVQAESNDDSAISFSISDGNNNDIFHIDPSSGVISLVTTLDYETQRRHGLIVRVVDTSNRESNVLLLVQVTDANDEVPLIPPSALLSVTQNQAPGHPVGRVECVDADANINNTVFNYTFNPASDQFSIDEFGVIRLEAELDNTPTYVIAVVCFDIRDTTVNSTGIVTIEVEFVNLHQPVFSLPVFGFSITEDLEVLSLLGNPVTATDNDIGSFSELMYDIEGEQDQFFIESASGRIGLLTSLDREIQDFHMITVIAVDGGPSAIDGSRRTGTTTVMVAVEDANDNAPIPSQLSYVQAIATNHTLLSAVLSVSCSDPDQGSNGTISYSLSRADNFIIQQDGTILLAQEQPNQAVYSFFVICIDGGSQPLSSSALVTVVVNFLALSAPVFSEDHYNATILENITVTTPVLIVQATPSDASITVVYSISSGNERERFFIDSVTGIISVRNALDAREEQYYSLVVRAGNAGSDQLHSLATVSIFVEDINDNSPSFQSQFYTGVVPESSVLLTPVVSVVCEDSDVNSDISYSITGGLSTPPAFNITQGGEIAVAGELDYEVTFAYSLEVTCSDGGLEPRTTVTTVRIDVSPVNEFRPQFSRPQYTFTATENDFGANIGSIEAIDMDTGSHGSIIYLLNDPGDFSVVFVDPTSGDIRVSNNLDYEFRPFWNLTVTARDGEGLQDSVSLNIEVVNVNDVLPVIVPESGVHSIAFDELPNTPLQPYECTDADGSTTTLSILSGNEQGYFALVGSVVVWTGHAAENLTANLVTSFTVRCHDDNATEQFADSIVAVSVAVTDAVPPVFTRVVYSTSVPEDTPVNSTALTVLAVANNTLNYSLLSLPSGFPFDISPSEGSVSLVRPLDHEAVDMLSFFVAATDTVTGAVGVSRVDISVTDINDNSPIIAPVVQSVLLPENHPLSVSFAQFECTDVDSDSNGQVRYEISNGDTFSIDGNGRISLSQPLDFESLTNYTLEVVCMDGADVPLSNVATLLVGVGSVNEYPPVFSNSTYHFSISEFARTGDPVGSVGASDLDAGLDGEISYSVLSGSGLEFFTLGQSGSIATSIFPLNATLAQSLELGVRATDGVGQHGDAVVVVTVEDVNEPPQFSGSGNYFASVVTTDLSPGDTLLQFTCYDTDVLGGGGGGNSELDLEISNVPSGLSLYLQTTEREGALDADLVSDSSAVMAGSYALSVTCTDRGNPPISSTTSITVRVDTLNTPPVFIGSTSTLHIIPEDTPPGTILFSVNATDAETGVVYSITGGTGLGTFQVDSATGSVTTLLFLDYETTVTYSLQIEASDLSPSNQMSTALMVTVLVINVNDINPRLFPEAQTQVISLREDMDAGSTAPLEKYTCSDPDGSEPPTITISSLDAFSPFKITPSGEVILLTAVNYEVQTNHTIVVTCTDVEVRAGEGTTRQTNASLIINVQPVNIHAPVFTSESSFEIPEGALVGDRVGTLVATDGDGRGLITFSSVSDRDTFLVGPNGNITLVSGLDHETRAEYVLEVVASDNDRAPQVQPRTAEETVVVRVTDENDNHPTCAMNVLRVSFETGSYYGPSLVLTQLNCSDQDSGLNSLLHYSLVEDSLPNLPEGSFVLNETSGELRFQGTIGVSGSHVLEVTVEDSGTPALSSRVAIVVQVETANEMRPRFNQGLFRVSISESRLSPDVILSGETILDDFINPLRDRVMFSLQASVDNNGAFIIDSVTADITLVDNKLLDFEQMMQYTLTIEARVNSEIETALAVINILDFNDNAPLFPRSIYNGSVPENEPPGTPVLRVDASDQDSGENSLIQYTIQGGGSLALSIDPDNGTITTTQYFDRETTPRYTIVVLATDMGVPRLTGSTTVTVDISDRNDSPPSFVDDVYVVSITDTTQPGDVVVTLRVIDEDEVGHLSLYIDDQDASEVFVVESTGELRLRSGGLQRPYRSRYNFTVIASDGVAMNEATVIIYVVSLTTDMALFEENVHGEEYRAGEFLARSFNISSGATYDIIEGDLFDEFEIESGGVLTVRRTLDRENTSRYDLTILVVDDTTSVNVELLVAVTVLDQNDNTPMFDSAMYRFSVSEGPYEDDTIFGSVNATDLDEPGSGGATIKYSLLTPLDAFAIDGSTGELYLKAGTVLDYETVLNFTILVQARDFGEPSAMASTALLVVSVDDINDNDPEFVPLVVQEYLVLLPFTSDDKIPPDTRLNKIIALLPFGIRSEVTTITITDPDPSSLITATLEGGKEGEKIKFGIANPGSLELELVTIEEIGKEDSVTFLQLVLRDEPVDEENNPVIRNISFVSGNDFLAPTTEKVSPDAPPFFRSAAGIAVIVVICVLILIFGASLVCLLCYITRRRDKDPLQDMYV